MTFLMLSYPERVEVFRKTFARELPEIRFSSDIESVDPKEVRFLMTWQCPDNIAERFPNLQALLSVSAGVDHLLKTNLPEQVMLVRMIDPGLTDLMRDYVVMSVLAIHRRLPAYLQQQRQSIWKSLDFKWSDQQRVSMLGLGQLGQACINALKPFGFKLAGWSKTPKSIEGVDCYHGQDGLEQMLGSTDILVCLLPLTEQTRHILNDRLFSLLPKGASLVQVGRGEHLDQDALLQALDSNHLDAAVLDVTDPEPLPSGHPFWNHPKIILTPHIAAHTRAETAAQVTIKNVRKLLAGQIPDGVVNRGKGY